MSTAEGSTSASLERVTHDDVADLGYEQARAELVEVVQRLEQGAATLEESLVLWERGEALATRCQAWLDGARQRLRAAQATASPQETAAAKPAEAQEES